MNMLHTLAEISSVGHTLSEEELELVAGGAGLDLDAGLPDDPLGVIQPPKGCPHTRPDTDDFTCLGGWLD